MADHFVGFSRGVEGFKASDFTTGAASTAGLSMELRVTDGAVRRVDVIKFLDAAKRFFENQQQTTPAGFTFTQDG
jgi:hypothetical protein